MEHPDSLKYAVADSIQQVALKNMDFFTCPAPGFDQSWTQSLEKLTTLSMIFAALSMIVLGIAAYLLRKKSCWSKAIGCIPILLGSALIVTIILQCVFKYIGIRCESLVLESLLIFGCILSIALGIKISRADNNLRNIPLKWMFVLIGIYGAVIYDIGMFTGNGVSLITNFPMAILYGFRIFVFNSDVSELQTPFHEDWLYSANFAMVHFLAAALTTLFFIKHFGFNILQKIRIWWSAKWFSCDKKDTFIFWGYNKSVYDLAKSIQDHYGEDHDAFRIIVIRTDNDDDDTPESRTGFSRIFNFISMRNSEIDSLRELGCMTVGIYNTLSNFKVEEGVSYNILNGNFHLGSVCKILLNKTTNKIHVLFLSDNEKENINAVSALLQDSTLRKIAKSENCAQVEFYCHARYNSVHRVIEDMEVSDNLKVRVVDSSHINVEMLKSNKELLPVNFVNVESDATVSSAFNSLVIGFSEVGQDSVRFLYEFGAFVKTGSTDEVAVRSDFHMHVVDKNMSDLAGTFVANAPSIKPAMPFMKNNEYGLLFEDNPSALITLHEMDCRSVEFYLNLENWIKDLNYIVIATEDDELNISLAVRVFKAAARLRKDMNNFCILVRTHNDEDGHIQKIAYHYNRIWAAYVAAPEVEGKRNHQSEVKKTAKIDGPIHVFGLDSKTYTYDNVIANAIEVKARRYKQRYDMTNNPSIKPDESTWDVSFNDIMHNGGDYNGFAPTYYGLMQLRRTQTQDFANSQHEVTKNELVDRALSKQHLDRSIFNCLTRKANTTQYIWPRGVDEIPIINRIAITLAQTEHLRWNASHEILGYVLSDAKDEVKFTHNCLIDWQHLGELTKSFDCNVADFILGATIIP